ncbi:hypothetical protein Tco_0589274 [Tanacetum coccineum]
MLGRDQVRVIALDCDSKRVVYVRGDTSTGMAMSWSMIIMDARQLRAPECYHSPNHPLTQTLPTRVLLHRRTARMVVHTQLTLSLGMSARIAETTTLCPSSFCKRYRPSYETPSPSSSSTLPVRKRYRGASKLVEDIEDESLDSDAERERV